MEVREWTYSEINGASDKTPVNQFSGTLVTVYGSKSYTRGDREFTTQGLIVESGGGQIRISVFSLDPQIPKDKEGQQIVVACGDSGKGLKVNIYKGERSLEFNTSGIMTINGEVYPPSGAEQQPTTQHPSASPPPPAISPSSCPSTPGELLGYAPKPDSIEAIASDYGRLAQLIFNDPNFACFRKDGAIEPAVLQPICATVYIQASKSGARFTSIPAQPVVEGGSDDSDPTPPGEPTYNEPPF